MVPIIPSHCFPAGWPLKGQIQNCPGIPGEESRWEVQAKDFAVGASLGDWGGESQQDFQGRLPGAKRQSEFMSKSLEDWAERFGGYRRDKVKARADLCGEQVLSKDMEISSGAQWVLAGGPPIGDVSWSIKEGMPSQRERNNPDGPWASHFTRCLCEQDVSIKRAHAVCWRQGWLVRSTWYSCRDQVELLAPPQWLITSLNSGSRGPIPSFWLLEVSGMHMVHIHTRTENTHIHTIK